MDFLRIRPRAIWAARGGRSTAIGLFVYVCQVFVSGWWLDRYRYGPVEWLWRTLMYGILQPMSHDRLTSSSKRPAEVCQGSKAALFSQHNLGRVTCTKRTSPRSGLRSATGHWTKPLAR
ncbi:DUF418 domain-containing protein [Bradyrhizobium sp. 168]|uniref:DUF418 domain-containing protein n=1 Tax=Bradyrhizobium sp. 168 TaxID=2782639 RepID=UPI00201BAD0E|nr:DUF418 domain-containing protein [Bradyrhizobium sp. 168]